MNGERESGKFVLAAHDDDDVCVCVCVCRERGGVSIMAKVLNCSLKGSKFKF